MGGRWLVKLYPRKWRDKYGEEMIDLLTALKAASGGLSLAYRIDLIRGALVERTVDLYARKRTRRVITSFITALLLVTSAATAGLVMTGSPSPTSERSIRAASRSALSSASAVGAQKRQAALTAAMAAYEVEVRLMLRDIASAKVAHSGESQATR